MGPIETPSLSNKRYVLTFIDNFSGFTNIYFLNTKDETFDKLKHYIALIENKYNLLPKVINSDCGTEYLNNDVEKFLLEKGIVHQTSVPYSPSQNSIAERKNRTLIEMSRTMLIESGLDKQLWAECMMTANYLQNRLPNKNTGKTPYELVKGYKPYVGHLKVFGSTAYAHIPKKFRKKLDKITTTGYLVGYQPNSKGYRIFNPDTRKIIITRSVKFDESKMKENNDEQSKEDSEFFIDLIKRKEKVSNNQSTTEEANNISDDISSSRHSTRVNFGVPPSRYGVTYYTVQKDIIQPNSFAEISRMDEKEKSLWFERFTTRR